MYEEFKKMVTVVHFPLNVVVTGGAGFIGSHLIERLLMDGHTVAVLDNFSTGRMENLNQVKDNPRLSVHGIDISNYSEMKQLFEDGVRIMLQDIDEWRDAPVWDKVSMAEATRSWFTYLNDSSSR